MKRSLEKEDVPVIVQTDAAASSGLLVRVIDEAKLPGAIFVLTASNVWAINRKSIRNC